MYEVAVGHEQGDGGGMTQSFAISMAGSVGSPLQTLFVAYFTLDIFRILDLVNIRGFSFCVLNTPKPSMLSYLLERQAYLYCVCPVLDTEVVGKQGIRDLVSNLFRATWD